MGETALGRPIGACTLVIRCHAAPNLADILRMDPNVAYWSHGTVAGALLRAPRPYGQGAVSKATRGAAFPQSERRRDSPVTDPPRP